jgi:hypothetical protein
MIFFSGIHHDRIMSVFMRFPAKYLAAIKSVPDRIVGAADVPLGFAGIDSAAQLYRLLDCADTGFLPLKFTSSKDSIFVKQAI